MLILEKSEITNFPYGQKKMILHKNNIENLESNIQKYSEKIKRLNNQINKKSTLYENATPLLVYTNR